MNCFISQEYLFYYVISKKSNNMLLLLYCNIIYNYSNDVTYY